MKVHYLKTIPKYFREAARGNKPFEVRKNDRYFKVGDIVQLEEWLPEEKKYTGRSVCGVITYILSDRQYCKKGFVILGIPHYTRLKGGVIIHRIFTKASNKQTFFGGRHTNKGNTPN